MCVGFVSGFMLFSLQGDVMPQSKKSRCVVSAVNVLVFDRVGAC